MRDKKTKAQIKNNYETVPTPCPLHLHPDMNQLPPTYPLPPIIFNNNTMDTEFLVQMRQSNKCGSVRNNEIFNLHLESGAGPWVSILCLLQDSSHIYWFHPPKNLTRKKQRTFFQFYDGFIVDNVILRRWFWYKGKYKKIFK